MERTFRSCRLLLEQGDLCDRALDAVVNSANAELGDGSGVNGAIHRRGGPALHAACKEERRRLGRPLRTGEAVITAGGDLPATWVIHALGPVYASDPAPERSLATAYSAALQRAMEKGLASVAFPSISTGVFGFPVEKAASIALRTVKAVISSPRDSGLRDVRFVLFSHDDFRVHADVLEGLTAEA